MTQISRIGYRIFKNTQQVGNATRSHFIENVLLIRCARLCAQAARGEQDRYGRFGSYERTLRVFLILQVQDSEWLVLRRAENLRRGWGCGFMRLGWTVS